MSQSSFVLAHSPGLLFSSRHPASPTLDARDIARSPRSSPFSPLYRAAPNTALRRDHPPSAAAPSRAPRSQSQSSDLRKKALTSRLPMATTLPTIAVVSETGTDRGRNRMRDEVRDGVRDAMRDGGSRLSLSLSRGPVPSKTSIADTGLDRASKSLRKSLDLFPEVTRIIAGHRPTGSPYDVAYLGLDNSTALSSTCSTAPASPRLPPIHHNSGSQTPRTRPYATTLNIPGMTLSKISPDGRIADRDVASKLVIIMVGLPARGKSYITKKLARYLAWQQYNTEIFNVGNRRRIAAGAVTSPNGAEGASAPSPASQDAPTVAATILFNGMREASACDHRDPPRLDLDADPANDMWKDQSAKFFDPNNTSASKLREQVALDTLDDLMDYLLYRGGSVGILDATNSTIHRRALLVERVRQREPKLGIMFIESVCHDPNVLEANMRLKLSGPDYKQKDPVKSLADFRERIQAYESAYQPLGDYEEKRDLAYIQMIDVGRKTIHHRLKGFLSGTISSYLNTFHLAPRQIWITRHGQSEDMALGKIGGDSGLTEDGHEFGLNLYEFITFKRKEWVMQQQARMAQSSFPPQPGDRTPPFATPHEHLDNKNFCVWTSTRQRSRDTAEYFDHDEDYDVKAWKDLNELNAGSFEGWTYKQIEDERPEEYAKLMQDKLRYVFPGVAGEGYLQIISRLQTIVRELERITDHVLIIGPRSVCRVLMAYFLELTHQHIADMDMPLGMVYSIEPKPYGLEFHAYRWNTATRWFDELVGFKPQQKPDTRT